MKMRWVNFVAYVGEMRNAYCFLIGKPKRKKSLGTSRRKWENNIKMVHREIGWESVDCILLARDRDKPSGFIKFGDFFS